MDLLKLIKKLLFGEKTIKPHLCEFPKLEILDIPDIPIPEVKK